MPTNTPNLKIPKPLGSETVSRASLNTIYDTIDANVVALPTDGMARQALINGNFDVWQRGLFFVNPGNIYTADRFNVTVSNSGTLPTTINHGRSSIVNGDLPNSRFYYTVSWNGPGSGFGAGDGYVVGQLIENGTSLLCGSGKKITVSFYAFSPIPNKKLGVYFNQRYGTGGSPSAAENINGTVFTLTPTWQKYSFTFATNSLSGKTFGTNNDDALALNFVMMWGSGSYGSAVGSAGVAESFVASGGINIAQVQVNAGDIALPVQPRSFGDELALCQRYYAKSFESATGVGSVSSIATGTAMLTGGYSFPVTMRISPTFGVSFAGIQNRVVRQSDLLAVPITGITFRGSNRGLSYLEVTGTPFTAGTGYAYDIVADAEL